MRHFVVSSLLLGGLFSSTAFAQQTEALNYNLVNVQAEASRQVSNDEMHAVLYIEKSNKQPAELASQITQLMNQAIATSRKYPNVKVETGSQTTYPIYDNDSPSKNFQQRAQLLSQSWNKSGYNLVNLNLNTSNNYPQPIMMRSSMAKFADAEAASMPEVAAGESKITVNANGTVQFK